MAPVGAMEAAAELTWIVKDALPAVEGIDLPARELRKLPKSLTLDEIKHWCEARSDCVGFAFWPWKGQWLPKRRGTGFIEEKAVWTQKKSPQQWQWFYLKERATESEGVRTELFDNEPLEEVEGTMIAGELPTGKARIVRSRMLAGISHESLAEKYTELAGDGSQGQDSREAAMLLQAATTSLNDEQYEESLKASEDAVELFRKIGNGEGLADALRIVIATHRQRGEEDKNLEERELAVQKSSDELEAFKQKGQRYGEAVMLLAKAESTFAEFGHERREAALGLAKEARSIFKELGSTKMEGIALLCTANVLMHIGSKQYKKDQVEEALETANAAMPLFQQCKSQADEAKALHAVAVSHSLLEAYDEAISNAKEALSVWREVGIRRYEAFEYYCIGQWSLASGLFQEALQMGERASTLMTDVEQKKGWDAATKETVIEAHIKLKDLKQAEMVGKDAVKQFQRSKDRQDEASLLESLMLVYLAKEDRLEALRIGEKALDAVQSMRKREDKNKIWEAYMMHTLSTIHFVDESFDKASKMCQDALRVMKEVGEPSDQAVIMNTLCHIKCGLEDYGDAARNGAKAREIFKEHGPRIGEAISLMSQSSASLGQGNIRRAVQLVTEALKIFQTEEKQIQEAESQEWLAQIYMLEGDNAKAIAAAKKGKDIFRDLGKLKEETLLTLRVAEASFMAAMEEGEPAKGGKVTGAWEVATKAAKDALVISRKTTDDHYIARGLYSVACVEALTFTGEPQETISEAITVYERIPDPRGEAYMQLLLGQYFLKDDALDLASKPLDRAVELFKQCQDALGEADAQGLIDLFGLGAQAGGGDEGSYMGPSQEMLAATVTDVALSLMGVESLAQDTPLMDAGLDSLASVEFQNTLQKEFTGVSLPSTLIFDFPSVKTLTDFIYQGLREASSGGKALK